MAKQITLIYPGSSYSFIPENLDEQVKIISDALRDEQEHIRTVLHVANADSVGDSFGYFSSAGLLGFYVSEAADQAPFDREFIDLQKKMMRAYLKNLRSGDEWKTDDD